MNNLKKIRESKHIKQSQLARMMNVDRAYIHNLESGKNRNPSLGRARLIAYYLGVDVNEIFPPENDK